MSKFDRIECRELKPGNIIRSGKEGYAVKDIEIEGSSLVISFLGTKETITVSPGDKAYIEIEDQFIDIGLEPAEVIAAAWESVSEWGWESDFDTP